MDQPGDFLANVAAELAYDLLKVGANRLRGLVRGSPEHQALQRVWGAAFSAMIEFVADTLDHNDILLLEDIFHQFVQAEGVADALLEMAVEEREPPLEMLRARFDELEFDRSTLSVGFDDALSALVQGLADALEEEAQQPGSPVYNLVSMGRFSAIQEKLDQILSQSQVEQVRPEGHRVVSAGPGHSIENTSTSWPLGIQNDRYYPLPGREHHLQTMLDALGDSQGCSAVVISGLGGLGKAAMAVELARRALNQGLFDGVVGDSARQESLIGGKIVQVQSAVLDFDSLLNSIVRQLGRWALLTLQEAERYAAVAPLLQQNRYLVLVDNLETAENANALVARLQGLLGSSRAIITSRPKVHHDYVYSLSLQQGLNEDDSIFFLRTDAKRRQVPQLLEAPKVKLIDIYKVTGGAPLALKLVVGQAASLDLDLVLGYLEQAGSDLYPFIFHHSWKHLTPLAQKILIYIGKTAVASVSWEELASAEIANEPLLVEAIDQLATYSLLEAAFAGGHHRYRIHQLTRHFVCSELPETWQQI